MPPTDPFRELLRRATRATGQVGRILGAPSPMRRAQTAGIAGLLIALATLHRLRTEADEDGGERRELLGGPNPDH